MNNKENEKKAYDGMKAEKIEFNTTDVIMASGGKCTTPGFTNIAVGLCQQSKTYYT